MKKEIKYFLVALTLLFISCGQKATTYEAKEVLSKHLIERYGEEFEIGYMGRRSDEKEMWYEAEIYPSKYVGTIKERDKYYRESGTVNVEKGIFGEKLGKAGDTYGIVKVNESAEEFYGKKLKELFGNNVLQVYDIWFNRILEDYSFENIIKVSDEERTALIIKGGIYIFGRVENDEEREWYRKQIYEFIQFMKETGTFEYVALWIVVADERVLSNEFIANNKDKEKLVEMYSKKDKEFREQRAKIMKKYTKSYYETSEENIKKRVNGILKSQLYDTNGNAIGFARLTYYNELLVTPIYSPKQIRTNNWNDKIKEYNIGKDVEFTEEFY
ncbi:hypothetical protein C4N20_13735 [Fusobacterium ulcerans]|uniref:Lipoprotein n=1 Tax=Fusobacterium ulcerans TaxID=861 RepID=A0AAX2JAD3_9FUSO|nr:hypothetical protein [Fusobacterium ulcerans]AVQ29102.1 hypothetical protein C4N20_13735 [Fusobacterium ulcerans]EFS27655.2 hypothetical protein FUAG_03170 [Fusobacterium ulcerans ATCC 49185]SQJ02369.1 Uncharacterised protein [Fusobacterium ulcerans]